MLDKALISVYHHDWLKGGSLDRMAKQMLAGCTLEEYKNSIPMLCSMADMPADKPVALLDFGCGLGRGLYHIGKKFPQWKVFGYDSELMIKRLPDVWGKELPPNVKSTSDWQQAHSWIMSGTFQKEGIVVVYCDLVLQHLRFDTLRAVMAEFRKIVDARGGGLIVHGRRCLDNGRTQVWPVVLENFSLDWIHGPHQLETLYGGDPNEHITAVFMKKILD